MTVDAEKTGIDQRLRHLADSDDEASWAHFLVEEDSYLRTVARSFLSCEDQVDDVLQETVMRLRRALPRYESRGDGEARTWLRNAVQHASQDLLRAERSRKHRERTSGDERGTIATQPQETITDSQLADRMESSLRGLPRRLQRIIELHYYRGLSFGEIAQHLKLTPHHTHVLHGRAIDRLRRRLVTAGVPAMGAAAIVNLLQERNTTTVQAGESEAACMTNVEDGIAATEAVGDMVPWTRSWSFWSTAAIAGSVIVATLIGVITLLTVASKPGDVIREIPLPMRWPRGIAYDVTSDTLVLATSQKLYHIDPHKGDLLPPVEGLIATYGSEVISRVDAKPEGVRTICSDGNRIWVRHQSTPMSRQVVVSWQAWDSEHIGVDVIFDQPLLHGCYGLAAADGRLWTIDRNNQELVTLDQKNGHILTRIPLPTELSGVSWLALMDNHLWVWDSNADRSRSLVKIDPATATVLARLPCPTDKVHAIAAGKPGTLWVAGEDPQAWLLCIEQ